MALGACGDGGGSGKTLEVTLTDFAVTPKKTSIAAGEVTFKATNKGSVEHEMVVFKVDDPSAIPVKDSGEADEDAVDEAAHMGEVEHVGKGTSKELKTTLTAGKYVLFCNLVTGTQVHYKLGMRATLTVE